MTEKNGALLNMPYQLPLDVKLCAVHKKKHVNCVCNAIYELILSRNDIVLLKLWNI